MPKDMSGDIKVAAVAGKPVELPSGHFIANAQMTQVGMDLHLTSPDGHTVVVENYFAQNPAPDLVSPDGGRLTPSLVSSFLPPEHPGQVADAGQTKTDASPAGKITEVVGDATVVHADGTKVAATVGMPIHQGDVIETSKTGAVNIQFTDNTTFAISESARMSVDQYVYHAAEHTGSTFFSMLQGVFVYTSGLIGKTDPGAVSIETPVGSIGIRGTVVAGQINPAGQDSKITILDGAIALTNGSGTQEMSTGFETVTLNSYQQQPVSQGTMDAQTFSATYGSVSTVAGDTMTHFTSVAPATSTPVEPNETAPATTAPQGDAPAPAPADGTTTTAPTSTTTTTATTTVPPPVMTTDAVAPPPPPPPTSSFGDTSSSTTTFSSTTDTSGTTFTSAPPPSGSTSGSTTTAAPPPPPPTGTTAPPPPPPPSGTPFNLGFNFSPEYLTTNLPGIMGVGEFSAIGTAVGSIQAFNAASGPVTYTIAISAANVIVPNNVTSGTFTTTSAVAPIFTVDATGNIFVANPLALSHFVNAAGFDITVTAVDTAGTTATMTQHVDLRDYQPGISPEVSSAATGLLGTTGANLLYEDGSANSNIYSGGGADVILAGAGNNMISILDKTFKFIDAGAGDDTIVLGNNASTEMTFTGVDVAHIKNIENIQLGLSSTLAGGLNVGNHMSLNIADVYNMTDSRHDLMITADNTAVMSSINVDTSAGGFQLNPADTIGTTGLLQYYGTFNGSTVYLEIQETLNPGQQGGVVVTDTQHTSPTIFGTNFTSSAVYNAPGFGGVGISEFAEVGTLVGTVAPVNANGAVTYSIAVNGAIPAVPRDIIPDNLPAGTYTAINAPNLATAFTIDASGNIRVNDPMLLSHFLNPGGFQLDITATDSVGHTFVLNQHVDIRNYGMNPLINNLPTLGGTAAAEMLVSDSTLSNGGTPNPFTNNATFSIMSGAGGADVMIGTGPGDNLMAIRDGTFKLVDGGSGYDRMELLTTTGTRLMFDFTNGSVGQVRNIEDIDVGSYDPGGAQGNGIKLNLQNVFDMTDGNHTLNIFQNATGATGGSVDVAVSSGLALTTGTLSASPSTLTYTGVYNSSTVTLIIHNGETSPTTGGIIVNQV